MLGEGPGNNIASSTDMAEWVSLLERKRSYYLSLRQNGRPIQHCLICRVPHKILEIDQNSYQPASLSIGPYHHGKSSLQVLEKKKWSYLNYILKSNPEKSLQDYLLLIEGLEQEARSCYSNDLVMESDEFIKMLLLDGCFLLVALYGIQETELPATGATDLSSVSENNLNFTKDTIRHITGEQLLEEPASLTMTKQVELSQNYFTDSSREDSNVAQLTKHQDGCDKSGPFDTWLTTVLSHDLFLLENQVPFFVVKVIYELYSGECDSSKIDDRIGEFLVDIMGYPIPLRETSRPNGFHHVLHFWHLFLTPTEDREETPEHHRRPLKFPSYFKRIYEKLDKSKTRKNIQAIRLSNDGHHLIRWRRAEQYHEAGVHFQKREFSEHDRHGLLDIRFTNGLLEIPTLVIACQTSSLFKNIIALEQTCPQYGNYFTSYCAFLSQIITEPADVTLLARRGILVHHMRTDEEVSNLLTKLGKNVDFDMNGDHYLKSVCKRMEEHYQSRVNRWMAWLWHNHFSNPWLSLAVLAASIVLICTILQLLFAFLTYINPAEA